METDKKVLITGAGQGIGRAKRGVSVTEFLPARASILGKRPFF